MTYQEWLAQQTTVRQASSRQHMENCRRLGELDCKAPFSEEAGALREVIRAYYAATITAEMTGDGGSSQ